MDTTESRVTCRRVRPVSFLACMPIYTYFSVLKTKNKIQKNSLSYRNVRTARAHICSRVCTLLGNCVALSVICLGGPTIDKGFWLMSNLKRWHLVMVCGNERNLLPFKCKKRKAFIRLTANGTFSILFSSNFS